jgi:hypothetical protein
VHFIRESKVVFTYSAKSSFRREIVLFDKGTVPTISVDFQSNSFNYVIYARLDKVFERWYGLRQL